VLPDRAPAHPDCPVDPLPERDQRTPDIPRILAADFPAFHSAPLDTLKFSRSGNEWQRHFAVFRINELQAKQTFYY
jgi:hypothetical protein